MKAGDKFWFAGRSLEFVRLRDQTAFVRAASGGGATPRWQGGRMPLSTTLADAMLDAFVRAGHDEYAGAGACGRAPADRAATQMVGAADADDAFSRRR